MKFKFNLQKVLDHRQTLVDLAQKEFSEAMQILTKAKNELRALDQQEFDARMQTRDWLDSGDPSTALRLQQIHQFLILQALRIEIKKKEIQKLEKGVEEKREILREKAIDHKILERLKEKRKTQFEFERNKKEQKDIDEVNVLRFETKDGS